VEENALNDRVAGDEGADSHLAGPRLARCRAGTGAEGPRRRALGGDGRVSAGERRPLKAPARRCSGGKDAEIGAGSPADSEGPAPSVPIAMTSGPRRACGAWTYPESTDR
jgi:hypothetical protein